MDFFTEVLTAFSEQAFPIVVCVILMMMLIRLYMHSTERIDKLMERYDDSFEKTRVALENNTLAITTLSERLDK